MNKMYLFVIIMLSIILSPDSGRAGSGSIAYLHYSGNFYQVWTMDSDGSNARQLTFSPGDKINISWLSNNTLICNSNTGELYLLDLQSAQSRKIDIGMTGMTDAEISLDGKSLLFSLSTTNSIDTNDIWLVSMDGKKRRKVTNMRYMQHHPIWGARDNEIFFLSGKGDAVHDIWFADLTKKHMEQLTFNSGYNFEPACSSRNELAFSSDRDGNYEIYLMNSRGENLKKITEHKSIDSEPSWSKDGLKLVFSSNRSGAMQIWRMNRDGSALKQLTDGDNASRSPKWH